MLFELQFACCIWLKLKIVLWLDCEIKLRWCALDQATLSNLHWQISDLGQLLLDVTTAKVEVSLVAGDIGIKLKGKTKPRTRQQV